MPSRPLFVSLFQPAGCEDARQGRHRMRQRTTRPSISHNVVADMPRDASVWILYATMPKVKPRSYVQLKPRAHRDAGSWPISKRAHA